MGGEKRILIAAADHDFITRLAFFLEDEGYETVVAWGGREAIEQLRSSQFDTVLVGEYLPDVDPKEFWQTVRGLSIKPTMVLLEVGQHNPEMVRMFSEAEGNCIVRGSSAYLIFESVYECLTSKKARACAAKETAAGRA
ncbi:MAG TPA: hypothetical protein VJW77_16175 [Terriglobia bacterium]|nr:hypothetical protein [Terriglobia bacterium]